MAKLKPLSTKRTLFVSILIMMLAVGAGCVEDKQTSSRKIVPREEKWGVYELDLTTEAVTLIYTYPRKISSLCLNSTGDTLAFSQRIDGNDIADEEICILSVDGTDFKRLTYNAVMDTYPCWAPDGTKIAFLSWRDETMDIYTMNCDGTDQRKLYDSGGHDGDIHWLNDAIAFTRNSQIWVMNTDGTAPHQITNPPHAGEWGDAVLPFGDYDPRISPDGTKIIFERLVGDETRHGNYNIYTINMDGSRETALTTTGYTQGLANWSHSGEKIVYYVTAIGEKGIYDVYMMNIDGTENHNITPEYFPATFLCHSPIFSLEDSRIYFVGEWWE
jgi:Tol biopolymer transport system component